MPRVELFDARGNPIVKREPHRMWPFVGAALKALSIATGCRWYYQWPFTFVCSCGCMLPPYPMLTKGPLHMEKQAKAWHLRRLQPAIAAVRKKLVRAQLVVQP